MTSKDREKTFPERFKQFFRMNKGVSGNLKSRTEFTLTPEIEKDLGPDAPLSHRMKTIRELSEKVRYTRLEDFAIEKLWLDVKDLLSQDIPKEHRHATFYFIRSLVQGQYDKLGMMRVHFFRIVKEHNIPEDTVVRFELLQSLTDNGKDILYFEEEIPRFMLEWMSVFTSIGKTHEFLSIMINIIKYNSAYVDEPIVIGLVQNVCYLCCWSLAKQEVLTCLALLDSIVCYSNFPPGSLRIFIGALCHTVNMEDYCPTSWKIMRNLLGTHLGHSALFTMCRLLQDPESLQDIYLLRGAIFFIYMSLWGKSKVLTLKYEPTAVLPSLLQVVNCNHPIVMYEMMLSIQMLVKECGYSMQDPAWDMVLSIMDGLFGHIEQCSSSNHTGLISCHLNETICGIEKLIELGQFNGSVRRVFELIERCSPVRPEVSVLRLVTYLANSIVPTRAEWLCKLGNLMERYFRQEIRTSIRVKVLEILSVIIEKNRCLYEDELIEKVVVPYLQHIDNDNDIQVRKSAAELLIQLCVECENKRCLELLDLLGKLLSRPFELHGQDPTLGSCSEADMLDVKTVVAGLVRILKIKIYQLPSSHAIHTYKLLVGHLDAHYQRPTVFENCNSIRFMIFECFLQLRANSMYQPGFPDPVTHQLRYSPFLCVDHKHGERPVSPQPSSPAPAAHVPCTVTHLSLTHACKAVVTALKQERDWKVLQLILQEVPRVMKNKALILSRHGNDVDMLAAAVCAIVSDKSLGLPEALRGVRMTRSELQAHVIPVLASLAPYHAQLDPALQQRTIKCLEYGLMSRCARQCITALTTCMLEMRDAMHKLLPEVLLNLSKISATVHIAIPILEFLSTLTRLPKVFGSFVGDQYMSVFAISLPYTNPFKYNHYTVSLAHHVIAVWFLKCRLPFRRDFVRFITTGLRANVLLPFEEGQLMKAPDIVNEDSSSRKRSSSLTEHSSRRNLRALPPAGGPAAAAARSSDLKPPIDEALMTFHVELTETCIDLMARYTFSTCYAVPKRLPTADFLLSGGQSMTWLVGNKLITVTTSGCSQKALRNGLCDKCWQVCHTAEPTSPDEIDVEVRNQKAPVQRSNSSEMTGGAGKEENSSASQQQLSRQMSVDPSRLSFPTTASGPVSSDDNRKLTDTHEPEPAKLDQLLFGVKESEKQDRELCACWCQGWAEIYVRRPTGDMSWVMRTQNHPQLQSSPQDFPLSDITTLFLPSLAARNKEQHEVEPQSSNRRISCGSLPVENTSDAGFELVSDNVPKSTEPINIPCSPYKVCPSRRESTESLDLPAGESFLEPEEASKARNPVRRSNSSPEMSANWKIPFLKENRQEHDNAQDMEMKSENPKNVKQTFNKDASQSAKSHGFDSRVSCEAIPEEMFGQGSTPPLADGLHPLLLPSRSYPGTVHADTQHESASKTVPPSPTSLVCTTAPALRPAHSAAVTVTRPPPPSPSQVHRVVPPEISKSAARVQASVIDTSKVAQEQRQPLTVDTIGKPGRSQTAVPMSPQLPHTAVEKVGHTKEELSRPDSLPPLKRDRVHTISVMSPVRKPRSNWGMAAVRDTSPRGREAPRSGISPSYVFLQLYHAASFGSTAEKPLLVPQTQIVERAVKNLDRIPPYETHKIGVVYVGPGQAGRETEILRNQFGSLRYTEFLQRLGTLIHLKDADPKNVFLGGLDRNGNDGKFAYIWQDDVMQVIFHVATLMPVKESEPLCNSKKMHIGNDYVTIVYNESGEEYNIQTLKGQFNYACVVIEPLSHGANQVTVKTREDLSEHIGHSEPKIVSDQNLAILARQLALHANLASMISCSLKTQGRDPYASNWLERLRQIKRLRTKVLQESTQNGSESSENERISTSPRTGKRVHVDDFTEYT
ncbi:tuberin isoform X1 [Schistocerca gregaria]|uniref:tuberin isoform X1 n=1 Tax=Schistocerca gregaria TaxID=7010 RepID=UPI00211DB441|nr:tuberin isoform X1 [Schistocerca gregaria]